MPDGVFMEPGINEGTVIFYSLYYLEKEVTFMNELSLCAVLYDVVMGSFS